MAYTYDETTGVYTVTFSELSDLLGSLDANTIDTSYKICISEITVDEATSSLKTVLTTNSKKYVSLLWGESALEQLKTITNAKYMFHNCSSLTSIDTSAFTSVTDARYMFYGCSSLTSIDTPAFTNVTDAGSMFHNCSSLTSIDTSAFTSVTYAGDMFCNCSSLTSIDTPAFTSVTNAVSMFHHCTSLTSIDTSAFTSVTNAGYMFYGCSSLTSIDTPAFTSVTDARYMFYGCKNLVSINVLSLRNATRIDYLFQNCSSLQTITDWKFDISKFTDSTQYSYVITGTPDTLKIYVKEAINHHKDENNKSKYSLVRVRKSGTSVTVKKQSLNETSATEKTLTVADGDTVAFYGKIDEIAVAPTISDDAFNKMIKYRYAWSNSNTSLDPSKSNFIIWAKDKDTVTTNLTNINGKVQIPTSKPSTVVDGDIWIE